MSKSAKAHPNRFLPYGLDQTRSWPLERARGRRPRAAMEAARTDPAAVVAARAAFQARTQQGWLARLRDRWVSALIVIRWNRDQHWELLVLGAALFALILTIFAIFLWWN